ncbi:MAG TPA: hypothetical protein VHC69_13970 [Polyangiaceae bacterium]|nr:hypothetical protein [Polyangiaceae bacterium]
MTSAADHARDGEALPSPIPDNDANPASGSAVAAPDKPSVAKCVPQKEDVSEDRPTWRPFQWAPRSPTGLSGTFEAVPSSKHRFSRRRVG